MRTTHKDAFLKKHTIKLGFMSAFVKAAAHALIDQPAVNAGETQRSASLILSSVCETQPKTFFSFQLLTIQPKRSSTDIM